MNTVLCNEIRHFCTRCNKLCLRLTVGRGFREDGGPGHHISHFEGKNRRCVVSDGCDVCTNSSPDACRISVSIRRVRMGLTASHFYSNVLPHEGFDIGSGPRTR